MARLVALQATQRSRKPGALKGRVRIGDDFDSPLLEEIARPLGAGS